MNIYEATNEDRDHPLTVMHVPASRDVAIIRQDEVHIPLNDVPFVIKHLMGIMEQQLCLPVDRSLGFTYTPFTERMIETAEDVRAEILEAAE